MHPMQGSDPLPFQPKSNLSSTSSHLHATSQSPVSMRHRIVDVKRDRRRDELAAAVVLDKDSALVRLRVCDL